MASKGKSAGAGSQTKYEFGADDDLTSGAQAGPQQSGVASQTTIQPVQGPTEGQLIAPEVTGDPPIPPKGKEFDSAGADAEVESPAGTESGEEIEASAEQLSAESGAETAVSDLFGIEGFEEETAAETAVAAEQLPLEEAGTTLTGIESAEGPEFGFLASLVPTLISTVGPPLAKAVAGRLKPRTRARVQRHASAPRPPSPPAAGGTKGRILSLISKVLESAESMPTSESAPAVDETLVAETVAVLEVIIGTDDRVRINDTTNIPWRRICALRIHSHNGPIYRGTGFLIGPRAIVTAGHCVYMHNEGGWARKIEVIPGANGPARPFGMVESTRFISVAGWVRDRRPESDYGCIVLPQGAFGGRNLGQFGFAALSANELVAGSAVLAGYPGDKPFAELWGMARKIKTVTADRLVYDIDTMGGQSGSGIYIKHGGDRVVVGIHNYGAGSGNSATRITPAVYQRLAGWRQL